MRRFILFAPNVGVGGGLVLLKAILRAWPSDCPAMALLNERGRSSIEADQPTVPIRWFGSTACERFRAERLLAKLTTGEDVVFCFHNLPPVFSNRGQVICYVHNPYLVGLVPLTSLSGWVRIRSVIERTISRMFSHRVHRYIVQTPTMAAALAKIKGRNSQPIDLLPFVDPHKLPPVVDNATTAISTPIKGGDREFDFLYVSDGQTHKNHLALFAAWELLADQGFFPSLALTLHPIRDARLRNEMDRLVAAKRVKIVDVGQMPHVALLQMYGRARALLFASYAESFGIPLVEASAAGLPILAAELDFVRDVCEPAVTFDPHSPRSIGRAVQRFLGETKQSIDLYAPDAFVQALLAYSREASPARAAVTGFSYRRGEMRS